MKTTVVPAQVTTVEDKVAGNLSFTQLLLMTVPIFLNGVLFILFPPLFRLTPLKFTIGMTLALACFVLAFRFKGKLLLNWIIVLVRYNNRPRFYLFNKNDAYLRDTAMQNESEQEAMVQEVVEVKTLPYQTIIPTPEMVRLESAVTDPRARFQLKVTRGGLRVHIHEVKE